MEAKYFWKSQFNTFDQNNVFKQSAKDLKNVTTSLMLSDWNIVDH